MDEQRARTDECNENESLPSRLVCQMKRRLEMVSVAGRVAGNSMSKVLAVLKDHMKDFGGQRVVGMGEIISAIRKNLPSLLSAARDCFTQQDN